MAKTFYTSTVSAPPTVVSAAPVGDLVQGIYLIDASLGAFSVSLLAGAGCWVLLDTNGSTITNPITVGTGSDTFNDVPGAYSFSGIQTATIYGSTTPNVYYVVEI